MTGRFALFADCLLAGALTALFALPVVTAYPAFVAACSLLRQGRPIGPVVFARRLRYVIAVDPPSLWLPPLALIVLALDALAVAAGVPGAKPLAVMLLATFAVAVLIALRHAGRWPGNDSGSAAPGWGSARWRAAAVECQRDPGGSALLALAAVCAAAIVVLVPITVTLVAGPLALAAVAVERRRHAPRLADL